MRGRVRSARPRAFASSSLLRRRGRPEPRAPRLDSAQALRQTRPGPWLDLVVAVLGLAPSHLEVLEPRISFFDLQELFGLAFRHHRHLPVVSWPDRRSGLGRTPGGAVATLHS